MDLDGVFWATLALKEAIKHLNEVSFFRKFNGINFMIWIEKFFNSSSVFIEVSSSIGVTKKETIIISNGFQCSDGWICLHYLGKCSWG